MGLINVTLSTQITIVSNKDLLVKRSFFSYNP